MKLKLASVFVTLAGTLALTQASAVAYPGDLAAGLYDNTTNQAGFGAFNPDGSGLSVQVNDAINVAKPAAGASTSTESATVEIDIYTGGGGFNGCYVLTPGQLKFDSQLGSASLQMHVTSDTATCNPFASIPTPFDVSVAWTGSGPLRAGRGLTQESCLDYRFEQTGTQKVMPAAGTATVTAFSTDSVSGAFSYLSSQEQVTHVQGTPHDSCPQEPGAVAGGAGPPNPGRYQTSSTVANGTLYDATGSLGVTLTDSTEVDTPLSAPATTTIVKQLNFSMNINGVYASGCFNLSPSDYTLNGVQSAEVTVNVDTATTCYGFPANMPPGQTLHVVWTNHSPVANFKFQGAFDCATYHLTSQGTESTSSPDVTVSLTMLGTVTPTLNSLTVNSNLTVAGGKKQPDCHI